MPNIDLGLSVTFLNNATNGIRNLSSDVRKLGENSQASANRLKAIQVVIGGILLQKTIELGKKFVEMSGNVQQLEIRMSAFAGGAAKAAQISNQLSEAFAGTGFQVDDLAKNWIRLQNVFGNNDKTQNALRAIVDDVSAMGGSQTNIDAVTQSLSRMQAKGSASMRELNSILDNTGVTLSDMAKAAGQSSLQFATNLQNGFITSKNFIDDFVRASQSKFAGFASLMKNTVVGSIARFKDSFSDAFRAVGQNTDINARIAVIFNNLADAVVRFGNSIKQGDIDRFFEFLRSMEPIVKSVGVLLYNVGAAVLTLSTSIAGFFGSLPPEVLEWGIIGYALVGKKAALVIGLLGKLDQVMGGGTAKLLKGEGPIADFFKGGAASGQSQLNAKFGGGIPELRGTTTEGNNVTSSVFGTPAQLDATKKALADLTKYKTGLLGGGGSDVTPRMNEALIAQAAYAEDLKRALSGVIDNLDIMNQDAEADSLGKEIAKISKQTNSWKDGLANILDKNKSLKAPLSENNETIVKIKNLMAVGGPIDQGLDAQKKKLTEIHELNNLRLNQEQRISQMNLQQQILEVNRSANSSAGFNILAGTPGGEAVFDVQQKKFQLSLQIEEAQSRIFDLQEKINANAGNPAVLQSLERTKAMEVEFQNAATTAMQSMTVQGEIVKQEFREIGNLLDNDLANGIAGLVQGTTTLGQITQKVFADMTAAAAKYLLKLAEAQMFGEGGGSGGGLAGGIGGGIASLLGFASGGVFKGGIKKFASGGIINGPTMFGLAGEAGTEAIMPLTNVGGKLGVRSAGGDGATHIHLHAVDTQSGVEFLYKHIDDIHQMISQRSRLNRA